MDRGWYCVRTRPRAEFSAAAELWRDGWEVWAPWYFQTVRRPSRVAASKRHTSAAVQQTKRPVFGGYIFVRMRPDGVAAVNRAWRVLGVVQLGPRAHPVPDPLMQSLFESAEGDQMELEQAPPEIPDFKPGEWVRLIDGPLKGRLAVVDEATKRDVAVWLEVLGGGKVRARAPVGQVERAPREG